MEEREMRKMTEGWDGIAQFAETTVGGLAYCGFLEVGASASPISLHPQKPKLTVS